VSLGAVSATGVLTRSSSGGGVRVSSWALGDASAREAWQRLAQDVTCVMVVVDAADESLWPQIRAELDAMLAHLQEQQQQQQQQQQAQKPVGRRLLPLLTVANKRGVPGDADRVRLAEAVGAGAWAAAGARTFAVECSGEQGIGPALAIASAMSVDGDGPYASSPLSASLSSPPATDPYERWLREAAAKQEEKEKKGSATRQASPAQFLLAIVCLFLALTVRLWLRRLFATTTTTAAAVVGE
jgi:hypothetical protein